MSDATDAVSGRALQGLLSQVSDSTSAHRLPTVSASEALKSSEDAGANAVRTGIAALDGGIENSNGGKALVLERGKVTEVWGPSGAGKTAIALQTTCNALTDGGTVVWVDCAAPLSIPRLLQVLQLSNPQAADGTSDQEDAILSRLPHTCLPSLAHLLAIILNPEPGFPPPQTSLIVIDNLHTLLDLAYPRQPLSQPTSAEHRKWLAGRRYAVLGNIAQSLKKMAALSNVAIIVTTGCATRMRSDQGLGACLVPGVGGVEWEAGVSNRLCVLRDFTGRFVGVQKAASVLLAREAGDPGRLTGFEVSRETGAVSGTVLPSDKEAEAKAAEVRKTLASSPVKPRKRNYDEIADSDGEDGDEYGWGNSDEDVFGGAPGAEQDDEDEVQIVEAPVPEPGVEANESNVVP